MHWILESGNNLLAQVLCSVLTVQIPKKKVKNLLLYSC